MKKLCFLSLALASLIAINAQNTFPSSGNVGIGTTTPTEDLEVNGTILTDQVIAPSSSNVYHNIQAGNLTSGTNRRINLNTSDSNDQSRINMYNSLGKLVLDLYTDQDKSYMALYNKNQAEIFKASNSSTIGNYVHMPAANSRIVIGSWGDYLYSDGHKLVVKSGSAMIEGNILTNNNIGIGTSSFTDGSDTYRLSVDGRIRAHAVKVYTDWADFVFKENYNLPSLDEVEAHIKKHGHLKDIPSAEEVEKKGIELGEMNKLLLQKIEELTLYTIQLKKEIDTLKSRKN